MYPNKKFQRQRRVKKAPDGFDKILHYIILLQLDEAENVFDKYGTYFLSAPKAYVNN